MTFNVAVCSAEQQFISLTEGVHIRHTKIHQGTVNSEKRTYGYMLTNYNTSNPHL